MRWLLRQCSDLLAYWILPFACFLLPVSLATALARFVARRNWFFRGRTARALSNASAVMEIEDPDRWQAEFRLVHFLDAVDLWHGQLSSDRRLKRALVRGPEQWPAEDFLVLLGIHMGPGTLLLRCLAMAGYTPALVYRDVPEEIRWTMPVSYVYQKCRIAYLLRVCKGKAIRVPGGSKAVEATLGASGCAMILVVDAPFGGRDSVNLEVLDRQLPISRQGIEMICAAQVPTTRFSMVWDDAASRRVIDLESPIVLKDAEQSVHDSSVQLQRLLEKHSAQWHLWSTIEPVLLNDD